MYIIKRRRNTKNGVFHKKTKNTLKTAQIQGLNVFFFFFNIYIIFSPKINLNPKHFFIVSNKN